MSNIRRQKRTKTVWFLLGAASITAMVVLVIVMISTVRRRKIANAPSSSICNNPTSSLTSQPNSSGAPAAFGECVPVVAADFLSSSNSYYIGLSDGFRVLTSNCQGCNQNGYGCYDAIVPVSMSDATYATCAFNVDLSQNGLFHLYNPTTGKFVTLNDASGRTVDPNCTQEMCMNQSVGTDLQLLLCSSSTFAIRNPVTGNVIYNSTNNVRPHNVCADNAKTSPDASTTLKFLQLDPVTHQIVTF